MNHLLNVGTQECNVLNRILANNKAFIERCGNTFLPFTFRYTTENWKIPILVHVDYPPNNNGVRLELEQEGGALLMHKLFPSFGITAEARKEHIHIINPPKDKIVLNWLAERSHGKTNLEHLYFLATFSAYAVFCLGEVLTKKQHGNTLEYWFPRDYEKIITDYINFKNAEYAKEHLLDGWDVVAITGKQYHKIVDTVLENADRFEYSINNVPLKKFALSIFDKNEMHYYFYEMRGANVYCKVADPTNGIKKGFTTRIEGITNGEVHAVLTDAEDEQMREWCETPFEDSETEKRWGFVLNAFFLVNTFMLHFGDVTMEVEEKIAKAPTTYKPNKKQNHRNAVRLYKTYKLVRNWKTQARKKIEITCPAWGVRGHFRHYKNGKTIFIEAFVKGKERDKYKGKEYSLLPYKDA